jgi:hypothetical protein
VLDAAEAGGYHRRFWDAMDAISRIIDSAVGARRGNAAVSVGTYLALATLNRIVAPCSKLAFADWWATTATRKVGLVEFRLGCDSREKTMVP